MEHMLDEASDKRINLIWYCVDSQSKRLFEDNLKLLKSVTKFYHNVPIVVVLTKAYSEYEKVENETMVNDALRKTKLKINVKGIVHVVARIKFYFRTKVRLIILSSLIVNQY